MKNKSFIPLMGFILLLGVTSCTEPIQVNPNYNPETKEVTTNLVLSVNTGGPQTKMTATNVQRASNFLGIDSVHIVAYKTDMSVSTFDVEPFVLNTSQPAERDFSLGTLLSSGSIDAATNQDESSNRIVQLSVPIGVDAFLFYGKGINKNRGEANATGKVWGKVATTPSGTHFDLQKRLENETNYKHTGDLLVFIINRIISTSVDAMTGTETYTAPGDPATPKVQYTNLPAISWQELGAMYDSPTDRPNMSPLGEILGAAYSKFTKIESGEYRAGSSAAIKTMMTSLMDVVKSVQAANPTNNSEANACRLADQISQRAGRYFNLNTMAYLGLSTIKENVIAAGASTGITNDAAWDAKFSGVTDIADFPYSQFYIPEGAAQLDYITTSKEFEYMDPNRALANPGSTFNPNNYLYPAEVIYYVNSPIRTTSQDVKTSDYPNGVNPWEDETSTGKWATGNWQKNSKVQSGTQGIAIRNNVNYGVALLETKVAIKDGVTELEDNKINRTGDSQNNKRPVNDLKIQLHGILVGGQNNTVDWQFLPKVASGPGFNYVVYDDDIVIGTIPTPAGKENYTLVFDNYRDNDSQSSVNVALEFKNEGDAFWGKDNLVPSGGIFYLMAVLPVATATSSSVTNLPNWPDDGKYAIPPVYGVDGQTVPSGKVKGHSKKINRVFIQNFVTSATFTLTATSLQKAYVTIPNLSSTQMSLGLSVDLSWHTGYTYNLEL